MKYLKRTVFLLALFLFNFVVQAQVTLYSESFETDGEGSRYTSNTFNYCLLTSPDTNPDFFLRTNTNPAFPPGACTIGHGSALTNLQGSYYWASEDIRSNFPTPNSRPPGDITTSSINISNYNTLKVSLYLATSNNNNLRWESDDSINIKASFDGVNYITVGRFMGNAVSGGRLTIDENLNGVIDGSEVIYCDRSDFTKYIFSIPGTGTALKIKLDFDQIGGTEELGIDLIEVTGIAAACVPAGISTSPSSSSTCINNSTAFTVVPSGSSPYTYVWQVNTGSGYTTVSNNSIYSNATTATLNLSNITAGMTGYLYKCTVNNTCGNATSNAATLTVSTTNTWTGATSSNWNVATNWSCGYVPTSTTDVLFSGSPINNPVIPSSVTVFCNNLTKDGSGISLTTNDATLKIYGNLIFNAGTIVSNNASIFEFIGAGTQSIAGTAELTANNLVINNGNGVTMNQNLTVSGLLTLTNGALKINDKILTLNGTITASAGTLSGSALSELVIGPVSNGNLGTLSFTQSSGFNELKNLTITRNAISGNVYLNNELQINNLVNIPSGSLFSNGLLLLKSTASATAAIKTTTGSGAVIGNVKIQRYIPGGRRAFRFFGHPYNADMDLTTFANYIDITGTGGSANGFTDTQSNNPSAFWYNVANGNGSTINDIGWTAFTSTNGVGANAWSKYKVARILVRGAVGEGLTGNAYTPSAVTITTFGPIKYNNQSISLTKAANSGYNIVGNPYPSQLDIMPALQAATNIGSAFWVWNPNQGTKGGYTSLPIASTPNYILPMFGAFVLNVTANTAVTFTESHKSITTPENLFRTNGFGRDALQLRLETDSIYWDRILLFFNNESAAAKDKLDADKLNNSEVNFYTLSSNNEKLSIDARPYKEEQTIPLVITTTYPGNYTIRITDYTIEPTKTIFLHDKYLGLWRELNDGLLYHFTVTADTASQGQQRFELSQKMSTSIQMNRDFSVSFSPNPATNLLYIKYDGLNDKEETSIQIMDMNGKKVEFIEKGRVQAGSQTVNVKSWSKGTYIVQLINGKSQQSQTIIKQ